MRIGARGLASFAQALAVGTDSHADRALGGL